MLIDISQTLQPSIAVWPGDTPFALQTQLAMADGAAVNLTTITMSAHTGAHADAPFHFDQDGPTLEQLDLNAYWGMAQIVTVLRAAGALTPDDFAHVDLRRAARLLVRTMPGGRDSSRFPDEIAYPSPELADALGQAGIILYGTDAPSMDHIQSKALPGHHAMRHNRIAILEGLDLSAAPDGIYELVALPLKISGGDGSPVRAVLRTITD